MKLGFALVILGALCVTISIAMGGRIYPWEGILWPWVAVTWAAMAMVKHDRR